MLIDVTVPHSAYNTKVKLTKDEKSVKLKLMGFTKGDVS